MTLRQLRGMQIGGRSTSIALLRAFVYVDCSFEKSFSFFLKSKDLNNGLKESIINDFLNSGNSTF